MNFNPVCAVLTLVLSASPLGAQRVSVRLAPGTQVRVAVAARPGWVTGRVATADSERIVLRATRSGAGDTVLLAAVSALEVRRGPRRLRRGVTGALLGGVIGAGLGAAAFAVGPDNKGEDDEILRAGAAALAVGAGVLIGGTVGALGAHERWERVPVR